MHGEAGIHGCIKDISKHSLDNGYLNNRKKLPTKLLELLSIFLRKYHRINRLEWYFKILLKFYWEMFMKSVLGCLAIIPSNYFKKESIANIEMSQLFSLKLEN